MLLNFKSQEGDRRLRIPVSFPSAAAVVQMFSYSSAWEN